ncbi:MAG: FAD-dependent oxidoreductase [bacterium]|nr:FAD-dependent oxidoreductase [bacterium]
MSKVGIIGGGIAGLTCAYRLSQKGIDMTVFEKEVLFGGRVKFSVLVGGPTTHPISHALVVELGLGEGKIPLLFSDVGIFGAGQLTKAEEFLKMIPSFPKEEIAYFQNFSKAVEKFTFNPKKFPATPEEKKLTEISFAEYTKDAPNWLKPILGLEYIALNVKDWAKTSASFGFGTQAPLIFFPKEEAYCFEENMAVVADLLADKIRKAKSEVLNGVEVKRVERTKRKFKIYFEKDGKEEIKEVEKVVFATPLMVTQKLFPELKIESNIYYTKGKCIFVKGKLKPEYDRKLLFGVPGDSSNLAVAWTTVPEEHRLYPDDINKKIDLNIFYQEYEILDEQIMDPAGCIAPPGAKIPELETEIEGVYICGDFYGYAGHIENAVASGEVVAEIISKD